METKFKSRKFWLAVGSGVGVSVMLIAGAIDQQVWQWAFGSTVVGYLVAQGAVDASEKLKAK